MSSSLTARTPPVGAITDFEKIACLVVCTVSAIFCVVVIFCNTRYPVLRQPPGRYVRSRSAFILFYTLTLVSIAAWLLTDVGKESLEQLRALAENETLCEAAEHAAESRGDSVYEAETYTLSQTAIVADLQLAVVRFWET